MLKNIRFKSADELRKSIFTNRILSRALKILFFFVVIAAAVFNDVVIMLLAVIILVYSIQFYLDDKIDSVRMELKVK